MTFTATTPSLYGLPEEKVKDGTPRRRCLALLFADAVGAPCPVNQNSVSKTMCIEIHPMWCILFLEALMRTNIVLDDDLVAEAMELTGITTKRALVKEALRVLIDVRRRRNLLELEGKIRFSDEYNYKNLREGSP